MLVRHPTRWIPQYHQQVLATDPIAYWILDEKQGAVAYDRVSGRVAGAQNGTHVAVTLGELGIGDGRTSGLYDGANTVTNILTAALSAAFNGAEGTALIWYLSSDMGVWTDGAARVWLLIEADANNFVRLNKSGTHHRADAIYRAGGVTKQRVIIPSDQAVFEQYGLTWSASAGATGEMRPYLNGVQYGVTFNNLGVWAGAPTVSIIGANTLVPSNVTDGHLCHCAVWDRALSPAEMAYLYASAPLKARSTYAERVLSYGPIAYWPQWEGAGATAYEQVNSPAQDGTYVGPPTFGQPGIGDGNTCPFYDGANDYTNAFSAALAGVFDGQEGTIAVWARVANVGVWTDGQFRKVFRFARDANNRIRIQRTNANNRLQWLYTAGGVVETINLDGVTTTDWMLLVMTFDLSAGANGEMRAYYNGAQTGATQTTLGTFVNPIVATGALIGAFDIVPSQTWDGWLAHCSVWDRALTPAEIAELYVV